MFISNIEELVDTLKPKLQDYLISKIGEEASKRKFRCYVHQDNDPSMAYNPKTGNTTVHCFSCGITHDLFSAANHFENLPMNGVEWVSETLPALASKFNIQLKLGETSPADRERSKLYKLANDITTILSGIDSQICRDYIGSRGWSDEKITVGSINQQNLLSALSEIGWNTQDIYSPLLIDSRDPLFGDDRITFVIRDYRNRPIGFVSRNIGLTGAKYVNSPESLIYEKRRTLLGIDIVLKNKPAFIYVVEGPGDLTALHRVGIFNAVAVCGAAFTSEHLILLKMLGIRQICLALDNDEAGIKATRKILREDLRQATGINCTVLEAFKAKDLSELLEKSSPAEGLLAIDTLRRIPAFEWILDQAKNVAPEDLCLEMLPSIASEPTAIKRELLIKILADKTGISFSSIKEDIASIRDSKVREKNERIAAAVEKYKKDIHEDPINAQALLNSHQNDLFLIEKEFTKGAQGVDYQLNRFDTLQSVRTEADKDCSEFILSKFTILAQSFSDGASWTDGAFIIVGGRANSGKTATCLAIGTDICYSDPEAVVIMHLTDDCYRRVEPRIKCNLASILREEKDPPLSIGQADNPNKNITDTATWEIYQRATKTFRNLIEEEKLFILDQEDGKTLTTLEKTLRFVRNRFPEKKIFVMTDGLHNYRDFGNLDKTSKMSKISENMKDYTGKYRCCIMSTGQYRKNMPQDIAEMKLPVDDDLADARGLMYDADMIIHVYQDIQDRKENATIYWTRPESDKKLPRLILDVSKNKLGEFKGRLTMDLDPRTVSMTQIDADKARFEEKMLIKRAERAEKDHDKEDEKYLKKEQPHHYGVVIEAEFD